MFLLKEMHFWIPIILGILDGGFKYFLMFTPILGEMIQFDDHIFRMNWNHPLVNVGKYTIIAWILWQFYTNYT